MPVLPEVSIIIVHYRTPALVEALVASIHRYTQNTTFEIIVVNNDSSTTPDHLLSLYPDTIWIDSGYNAGFSRANNLGLDHAKGNYVLLLNPDAEFRDDVLAPLVAFYKLHDADGKLGAVTCRIHSSKDGHLQVGTGIGFPSLGQLAKINPLYLYACRELGISTRKVYQADEMHYRDHPVDFVSGACALIRRDKLVASRLRFDEDFFLYFEDVNWSLRVLRAGYRNYHCAGIMIYHVNSASTGRSWAKDMQMQVSSYLFYLRAYSPVKYWLIGGMLWLNYRMNIYLLTRAGQKEEADATLSSFKVFRKYFPYVWQKYYPSSPPDHAYLRYEAYGDPS